MLTMIDSNLGMTSQDPHDQDLAIDRFAIGCGVDLPHGRQVARLAGQIFAQLGERYQLRPKIDHCSRRGAIARRRLFDRLRQASQTQLPLDPQQPTGRLSSARAGVDREYRPLPPRRQTEGQARQLRPLAAADQERVRRLAAILRIAGGLDRSHSQQVRGVELEFSPRAITMYVQADEMPEVDLWGARRRCDFFEWVFDIPLRVEWRDPAARHGPAGSNGASTNGASDTEKASKESATQRPESR